jgi:uncharacterized protein
MTNAHRVFALTFLCCALSGAPSLGADEPATPREENAVDKLARDGFTTSVAVPIPMRDGVHLSAVVTRPVATDAKVGTILVKTPYTPAMELSERSSGALLRLLKQGYAIAIVNDRGTGWSEGVFHTQAGAGADGYDTLSWIASQPWSNGKVGTFGCSSSAENQWSYARLNHPAHKAMVIMSSTAGIGSIPGYRGQGLFYIGGVTPLAWTWWYLDYGNQNHPHLPPGLSDDERSRLAMLYSSRMHMVASEDLSLANHLPLADMLVAANAPSVDFTNLITLTPTSSEWGRYDFLREGDTTRVPGLHIDSWYTFQAYGTTKAFEYLSGNSPNQHLVMGPTSHCMMGSESEHTVVGDHDVGDARFDYETVIVDWFNHWLRNENNATVKLPKVQYYPLNANHWRSASAWPVPGAKQLKLFLDSDGAANSLFGNGRLVASVPRAEKGSDTFVADPSHPVPSKGGGCCDPKVAQDQATVEARQDVLVYTTEPLPKDLDVAGYITANLWLSSSARDTDVTFKVTDVYPDGRSFNVVDSARRVRYREGYASPNLMEPGQIYEVPVDEMVLAARFLQGHRIRIQIAGSNFPNLERNLNTGGNNFDESKSVVATNRLYHDSAHPSSVTLTLSPD